MNRIYSLGVIKYNVSDNASEEVVYLANNGRPDLLEIRPFRATFYNPHVVNDMSRVVSPPYDVIDEARKERLRSRSPYNIVRLILPGGHDQVDFWNHSASLFRAWKKGEVMIPDASKGFYLHRQTFCSPLGGALSRTGVIVALRCQALGESVMPHEKTFPRVRSERLHLLRACRANFSQVFTVYRDPGEEVLPVLEKAAAGDPLMEFRDDEGVEHRLWRLEENDVVESLARAMAGRKLIIADGHHRYETALAYSREDPVVNHPDHPGKFVSVTLVRSEDAGLIILPVHRVLDVPLPPLKDLEEKLSAYFELAPLRHGGGERRGSLAEVLMRAERPSFLMATREGVVNLVLRPRVEPYRVIQGGESRRWKELDISILHALVFKECLGLDPEALAENGKLSFTPWESEALDRVDSGAATAAFLVRSTRMEDIWEIAEGGERMPHKSSYFHPKLPSGMVIYDHETAFG